MDLRLPAAAALLAVGAATSAAADRARVTPRPPAGAEALLGGFTALAVQAVWFEADRAIVKRDEDRAVVLLRTLVDLEPQMVSAARYAAQEIGWNMLLGRDDPAVRWGLAREALDLLDACVDRNPGSAEALRNRGRYLLLKVAGEDVLTGAFAARRDRRGPLAAAFADLRTAFARDPADTETSGLLGLAAARYGIEHAAAGRWDDARDPFAACVAAYDRVLADARETLGAELDVPGEARDALEATLAARARAAALLTVADAPEDGRAARLAEVRARFPDLPIAEE